MQKSKPAIGIFYLGKRGGGGKLLLDLLTDENLTKEHIYVIHIISNNSLYQEIKIRVDKLNSIGFECELKILSIFELYFTTRKFISSKSKDEAEINIFLMLSHRDWRIWRSLSESKRFLLIHDPKAHKGDIYPFFFSIPRKIKSGGKFFTFSKFVSEQLQVQHGIKTKVLDFPRLSFQATKFPSVPNILVLGRLKSYQGLSKLKEIDFELRNKTDLKFSWTIAGRGKIAAQDLPQDAVTFNRWLTDEEIQELIEGCTLQLLPYNQATQSGQIHYANSMGKPVVVTPVGGLPEQITPYLNGLVAESEAPIDIANAILIAFEFDWASIESRITRIGFIDQIIRYSSNV